MVASLPPTILCSNSLTWDICQDYFGNPLKLNDLKTFTFIGPRIALFNCKGKELALASRAARILIEEVVQRVCFAGERRQTV